MNNLKQLEDKQFINKLRAVLGKNVGYNILKNVAKVLQNNGQLDETLVQFKLSGIPELNYMPIVISCDVKIVFPQYKNILADNRPKFTFENLSHAIVIKCNSLYAYNVLFFYLIYLINVINLFANSKCFLYLLHCQRTNYKSIFKCIFIIFLKYSFIHIYTRF